MQFEISKSGPKGNAFYIMGETSRLLRAMGKTKQEIETIMQDMQSSNYTHLCEVAERESLGVITFVD